MTVVLEWSSAIVEVVGYGSANMEVEVEVRQMCVISLVVYYMYGWSN